MWRVDSGEQTLSFRAQHEPGLGVTFSPDGAMLATAGDDGAALWSVESGDRLHVLAGAGRIEAVSFDPSGSRIATAGDDTVVRIWDVETGRETLSLFPQATDILADVEFSPDGGSLAVTSGDGSVRVYVLALDELVRLARGRLTRGLTDGECEQFDVEPCPPSPATAAAGSPNRPPSGSLLPQGAFRSVILDADLLRAGLDEGVRVEETGVYTLSLSDGTFRIHKRQPNGPIFEWETFGSYTVSGDRITFNEEVEPNCFGNRWFATWRLDGATLTFTDISSRFVSTCVPQDLGGPLLRARFGSHPWEPVGNTAMPG